MDWVVFAPVGAGVLRSVAGWGENALQDGKISSFEWRQLLATVVQVSVISVAAVYGLELDVAQAAGISVLVSFVLSAVKKGLSKGRGRK